MFKYIILILLGAVVSMFLLYYLTSSEYIEGFSVHYWWILSLVGAFTLILLEFISIALDRLIPWRFNAGYRMLLGFLVINVVVFCIDAAVLKVGFGMINEESEILDNHRSLIVKLGILSVIFSLIYSIIYFARASYKQFALLQVETIRQDRKQIDLQLKALKSQLSPHFLFNSLNSVSSLIHENGANAETFVRRLALMYRYILESYEKKLVPLADEMKFASAYHHLLSIRFGDNLVLNNQLDTEWMNSKIPPVTIQMLIENAIKHNIVENDQQLKIDVKSTDNYLIVENNITRINKNAKSHKIGLKNIKARYKLLTGKQVQVISENEDSFTVKLPLIK